jgi:hypothetical protein
MQDVLRHSASSGGDRHRTSWRSRVLGVVLYSAVVVWCFYQLPDVIPFVVPGAVLGGGLLHVWRGRPALGLLVFLLVVVVLPVTVWPSLLTGAFSDFTNGQ